MPSTPSAGICIRAARDHDLPEILAIYNDVIATSAAVYSLEPTTLQQRSTWLSARTANGFPVLVAELGRSGRRLSLIRVGHVREVGRKFGRWLDMVLMQRYLDALGAPRAD